MSPSAFARGLAGVLLGAAALRALHLWLASAQPDLFQLRILDSETYWVMADHFLGRVPSGAGEEVGVYRLAPLYGLFLAGLRRVFGDGWLAPAAVQQALGLGSIAWVGLIGRRCFGGFAGVAGAGLVALYGALAMNELKALSETLATFLSLAAVHELLRARAGGWRWALLWPGVLLGLACIARPNTLLFCPLAALWWLAYGEPETQRRLSLRRVGSLLALTAGVLLAVAPVTLRNERVSGEWILISPQGGVTFYQGNNPRATGVYSRIPGLVAKPSELSDSQQSLAARQLGHPVGLAEAGAHFRNQGLRFLTANPGRWAWLWLRKLAHWAGSDEMSTEYVLSAERALVPSLWLFPLPFGVLLGLAAVGVLHGRLRGPDERLVALFVASNLATVLLFYFSSRYRLPATPFVGVLAGGGCAALRERFQSSPSAGTRAAALALGVAGLSLLSFSPAQRESRAAQFWNYGARFYADQRWERAADCFRRALDGRDDSWQVHHYLAASLREQGDLAGAVRHHERAVGLRPEDPRLQRLLDEERALLRGGGGR